MMSSPTVVAKPSYQAVFVAKEHPVLESMHRQQPKPATVRENYNDQDGEQQEGTLSKRRFHGSVDRQHQSKRACKDGEIHHEAKLCQRAAQTAFYKG